MRILLEYDVEEDEFAMTHMPDTYSACETKYDTRIYLSDYEADLTSIIREDMLKEIYFMKFIELCEKAIRIISNPTQKMKDYHEMVWVI